MFLPEKPYVCSASIFLSSSVKCLAYLLKIAARECVSGKSNFMLRSILLSMARSKSYFLFVAQMSMTLLFDQKLSIFLSRVDRTLRLASCISDDLLPASASIQSMKMITLPIFLHVYHIYESFCSLLPQNQLIIAQVGIYIKGMFTCCDIILALVVFPVPGGPQNNIAFGRFGQFFILVCSVISSYIQGQFNANNIVSQIDLFCFQYPAKKSQSNSICLFLGSNTVTPNYSSFLQS